MPRFEAFVGLRYDPARVDLADATAPPYDVVGPEERAVLAARSSYNAVHVDLPVEEDGLDRYQAACRRLQAWQDDGVLVPDTAPSLTVYRMGFTDDAGHQRQTVGVIGALGLSRPGEADVLPHERTTPKARSDRLEMLRACRANSSAVWVLSLAEGLSRLCPVDDPPLAAWRDDDGVGHEVWRVTEPALIDALTARVAEAPVVIADGHHRYETSLAYCDERRAEAGGAPGPYDLTMAYVVELAEDQLTVRPTHRLLHGLPEGFDPLAALAPFFDMIEAGPAGTGLPERMAASAALALVLPGGAWLLHPKADGLAEEHDLDSSRLEAVLATFPPHELTFEPGAATVVEAVQAGKAQAGVLLRPATVAQIADTAHARDRMPPKTTFFAPKPKTGVVFRRLG